ncbi:MAG: ATP-dependent endonuclease [Bacteroidetes bacterium 4572_77]|nr:MAG: ATP-dependent endonuclease [Bacteroidetes bacterium 4572_77]
MNPQLILKILKSKFPHQLTLDQEGLFVEFVRFVNTDSLHKLFVLKGYAGTGKTSFVRSVVETLPGLKKRTVLLAPTGRAAKVLSAYSGKKAFTIHKKIYFTGMDKSGYMVSNLRENLHLNTLFIVDEASMISGYTYNDFGGNDLLSDLISYVYSGENCHLMLIGDVAQLPPVGINISPALNIKELQKAYDFDIFQYELQEVVRQAAQSGILFNATAIRKKIQEEVIEKPLFCLKEFEDIKNISGVDFQDILSDSISQYGEENVVVITRSNKRANIYNREIRNRILYKENRLESGDLLMVVRNNYFWLEENSQAGFIANGDIVEVVQVKSYMDLYGFEFAQVEVQMIDYPEEASFDTTLLLSTLDSESPSLSFEENNQLYQEVMKDYAHLNTKKARMDAVKKNPYFNALQIKFATALTCHKTQGGQWDVVFLEQPWLPNDDLDVEFGRWLYTAVTRATQKLYLVNYKGDFFEEDLEEW